MSRSLLGSFVALAVAGAAATAAAEPPLLVGRLEVIPVPSVTLDAAHFLRGEKDGKPAQLGGELRLPPATTEKFPAVILVHGSGGISANSLRWADDLNAMGIAVFILDSFAGRGIVNTVNDQSQLSSLAMMVDLFRAQAILAEHPRIDRNRIAVMGFSKGAVAAVYSAMDRFRKLHATTDVGFAAHIGMYTPCDIAYRDEDKVTKKPIRLFHGTADDYVAVGPCRAYVARLKKAGADATLTEYPDALHAYDNQLIGAPRKLPQAATIRACSLREGDKGEIVNGKTGKAFDQYDPCIEKGPQIGYNAAAHQATIKAVKEFLGAALAVGK